MAVLDDPRGAPVEEKPKPKPRPTPQPVSVEVREATPEYDPPDPVTKQDVAAKLLAKQLKEEASPTFLDQYGAIHRRSTSIPQQFVYENPIAAARFIMSSLPEEKLDKIVQSVNTSYEWLKTRERFAGIPGGMIRARANALQIKDPEMRRAALFLLDRIGNLPEADQQVLYANLLYGEDITTGTIDVLHMLFPSLTGEVSVEGDRIEQRFEVKGEEYPADVQEAQILKALFPRAGYTVGGWEPNALQHLQHSFDDAFSLPEGDESALMATMDVAAWGLETTMGAPFEIVGAGLSKAFRHPANRILGGTLIANLVGGGIRGGFGYLNRATMPVAKAAVGKLGLSGPEEEKGTELVNAFVQLLLLHEAGKISSSLHISRKAPAEMAAARLGIVLKNGDITNPKVLSVKQTIWKYFNVPMERWLEISGGKRFLADIELIRDKLTKQGKAHEMGAALGRRYGEFLPERLRNEIAGAPKELVPQRIIDYYRNPGGPKAHEDLMAQAAGRTDKIRELEEVGAWEPAAVNLAEIARLKVERYALERQAELALTKRPLIAYPKKNVLRAALLEPTTRLERVLNRMFRPEIHGKMLWDAANLVQELPRYPVTFGPGSGAPLNWREVTGETTTKIMRRLRVPDAEVRALVDSLKDVRTSVDYYKFGERAGDLINRFLPRKTPPEIRTALTRFWDTGLEGRSQMMMSIKPGERVGQPVIPDRRTGASIPSRPTEQVLKIPWPDVELMIDATSAIRRAARKTGMFGHLWYDVPRFMMRFATGALKAPILVLRIPALVTRIQLEQAVRLVEYGGAEGFWPGGVHFRRGTRTGIEAPEPRDLGSLTSGSLDDVLLSHGPAKVMEKSTLDFKTGARLPKREHFNAWAEAVRSTAMDWFDSQFVRLGLDPVRMQEWVNSHPGAKRYVEDKLGDLRENYESAQGKEATPALDNVLVTEYLTRKADAIRNTTGGDAGLLRSLSTGSWAREPRGLRGEAEPRLVEEYNTLMARRASLKEGLETTLRADRDAFGALQRQLLADRARMQEIEARLGRENVRTPKGTTRVKVKADDAGEIATELGRAWRAGELEMPDTLVLKSLEGQRSTGRFASLKNLGDAWNRAWYSAFTPVSWADMHGTRGSLFYQIANKERNGLLSLGWEEKAANAHAEVTAAAKTSDIMYDLSARTSLHRSLKDIFWFGPAQAEVLYTWAVKIPSRYYPGIGHAILAGKLLSTLDMLRAMGIVRKNAEGEDVVAVPGLEQLFAPLIGDQRLKSFNLVTGGSEFGGGPAGIAKGFIPGLSTFPSVILGKLALEHGGAWKELADVMLPYGPDVSVFPRPIVYALETLGVDNTLADKLSSALFGDDWETAKSRAFQIANAEMIARGDEPPRVEDYPDDEAGADAYRKARTEWLEDLQGEADDYLRSQLMLQFLGATVAPASIRVSTKARDAWIAYRNRVIDAQLDKMPSEPDGGWTEDQLVLRRELTDAYVEKHPEAFPYTVSYYELADEEQYPKYKSAGDDDEFDALYRGEYVAMTADDYEHKFLMLESMRHYAGQRNAALEDISPTLDPVEILLNWNKRTAAMDRTWSDMDRYFTLNPEAGAYYRDHKLTLHDKYGTPINTFQADRLAETARALRLIGRQDVGLEAYDKDQVEGAARVVSALYSESGIFGKPNTDTERGIAYFWEEIYGPYRETRNKLFDLAGQLSDAGRDTEAGLVYERLRKFENAQEPVTANGITYPTPEEVRWGMLTRQDQKDAARKWATRPPEWLTTFQVTEVYGDKLAFEGAEEYLHRQAELDKAMDEYMRQNDVSTSSNEYEWLKGYVARKSKDIAADYGPEARKFLALSDGTPYDRLKFAGKTIPALDKLGDLAGAIGAQLTKDGYSIRGTTSNEQLFYKKWLYTLVEKRRVKNDALDEALDDLSATMAESGQTYKTGVPLYEALFFGNFMSEFIPDELTAVGSVG